MQQDNLLIQLQLLLLQLFDPADIDTRDPRFEGREIGDQLFLLLFSFGDLFGLLMDLLRQMILGSLEGQQFLFFGQ